MIVRIVYLMLLTTFVVDGYASVKKTISTNTSASNSTSSVGFSSEPKILSGDIVAFPAWVIKKGLGGTVTLAIDIDQNGKVEKRALTGFTHTILDSIALASINNIVCSPAFEMGKAVASTVSLQIEFIPDSMVLASRTVEPDIEGVVLDKTSKRPLVHAIVNMEFIDTLRDQDIAIGFGRYMELIGNLPKQKFIRGVLSTTTDASGRFSFRLLPFCPAKIAVLADGYEIAHFYEYPKPDKKLTVGYFINSIEHETIQDDSSNIIKVYGRTPAKREMIHVERSEYARGLSHSASKLLLSQTTIRQMPEGCSALLVRAGSPFDNRYLIAGVPFLSPYHFGGYPYGDLDGMMISALTDIKVTVNAIAGRFADVSGALVEANPGIYRQNKLSLVSRPEISVDFGRLGCDLMLSVPTGKNDKDIVQIGYTAPDWYSLKCMYSFYGMSDKAAIDLGAPVYYRNITINNSKKIGLYQYDIFGWYAEDFYNGAQKSYPWGMGSVSIHPVNRENISLTCGGSHQYFAKGKRVGQDAYVQTTYLTNGTMSFSNDSIPIMSALATISCRLDYQDWQGTLEQRDSMGIPEKTPQGTSFFSRNGKDVQLQVQSSIEKEFGILRVRTQVLGVGIEYDKQGDVYVDAGVSLLWNFGDIQTELNAGRVTSRPDVRGLPDTSFRMQQLHSYLVSLPIYYRNSYGVKIGIQPYLRYQDKCPQMDPLLNIWNRYSTSPLSAKGVDIDAEVQLLKNVALNGAVNIEDAKRVGAAEGNLYEWNVPWSVRSGAHCSFVKKYIHVYIDYVVSKGMPYFDFNENRYRYLPVYGRTDVSLQFRTLALKHRYLTRYDGYLTIRNIFDRVNVRDYYWNKAMIQRAVYLSPFSFDMGVRVGFRL